MTAADIDLDAIREPIDWDAPGRCWDYTLAAFGVSALNEKFKCQAAMNGYLRAAGYTVEELDVAVWRPSTPRRRSGFRHQSLGRFITDHPTGSYVIGTGGHVMALRDGRLTDTDMTGTGRRHVHLAYRITKTEE